MAVTITNIEGTNGISSSRSIINQNFLNLKNAADSMLLSLSTNGEFNNTWGGNFSKITTRGVVLPASSTGIVIGSNSTGITLSAGNSLTINNLVSSPTVNVINITEGNIIAAADASSTRGLIRGKYLGLGYKPNTLTNSFSDYHVSGTIYDYTSMEEATGIFNDNTVIVDISNTNKIYALADGANDEYFTMKDVTDTTVDFGEILITNSAASTNNLKILFLEDQLLNKIGTTTITVSTVNYHDIIIPPGGFVKIKKVIAETLNSIYLIDSQYNITL